MTVESQCDEILKPVLNLFQYQAQDDVNYNFLDLSYFYPAHGGAKGHCVFGESTQPLQVPSGHHSQQKLPNCPTISSCVFFVSSRTPSTFKMFCNILYILVNNIQNTLSHTRCGKGTPYLTFL